MTLTTGRIGAGHCETVLTERVAVELADIVPQHRVVVGIFKLQDVSRPGRRTDFYRLLSFATWNVSLRPCATVCSKCAVSAACCWILAAHNEIDWEAASVDDLNLPWASRGASAGALRRYSCGNAALCGYFSGC